MGADNHPTTEMGSDVQTVNGHVLADLEGVEAAFSYLKDEYNDGHITRNIGGDRVLITSRYRSFQHMERLLDAHANEETPVRVANVYAHEHAGEVRTRVEVSED